MSHIDLAGMAIKLGDFIVYAALWSRSAVLKFGKVLELTSAKGWREEQPEIFKLKVKTADFSYKGWELQAGGRAITLSFLDRLLVIPEGCIPDEPLRLLKGETE